MYMYLPTGTRNARQRERSGDVTKRTVSFVVQWTEIEGKLLDKNGSRLTEFSNTWKLFVIGIPGAFRDSDMLRRRSLTLNSNMTYVVLNCESRTEEEKWGLHTSRFTFYQPSCSSKGLLASSKTTMVEKQTVTLALKDKTFLFCGAGIAWVQWRRSAKKRPIFRYGEKSQSLILRKRVASDVVTMPAGSASSIRKLEEGDYSTLILLLTPKLFIIYAMLCLRE
ncbi:hypothetical protein V1477_012345 [Vespula maculifrons]|uniref:Uncharacterized protein n=1 Tax=Vespula maculifrons TaxID=7453 RepID=A0ABD2BXC4_VESMC